MNVLRRQFRLVLVFLAGLTLVIAAPAGPSNEIVVHFVNVGQGDCTLVVFPNGKRLVVDCGSTGGFNLAKVRAYLTQHLDPVNPKVDLLVVTHPDQDHYNKIPVVFGDHENPEIRVEKLMLVGPSETYSVAGMNEWIDDFPASRLIRITNQAYNTYPSRPLPGFESEGAVILAANVLADESPANAKSVVVKISHGAFDVMITGDATSDTDAEILRLYAGHLSELEVEVWKGAHHGSWTTATHDSSWANAVSPEAVVFSASSSNTYGHPNRKLAELFKDHTVPAPKHTLKLWEGKNQQSTAAKKKDYQVEAMYSTASSGNIRVRSSGTSGFSTEFGPN